MILQYNYSEDSEGGFVEILGDNVNSGYRFNVSVNDGFRDNKGNTIWVSDFAGTGNRIPSDSNYIYNNSIYVSRSLTPDIHMYDIYGRTLFSVQENLMQGMNRLMYPIDTIENGIHIISVNNGKPIISRKILILK